MNRTEKIKSLQAIRDGRLKPSDILPPKNYLIMHDEAKGYIMEGRPITENEYRGLVDRFNEENSRREHLGLPVGFFITVELIAPQPVYNNSAQFFPK